MGAGGISIWQLLIILVIVLLLFGTKRLKNIGADLGDAIKGFRSAMNERDRAEETAAEAGVPPRVTDAAHTATPDPLKPRTGAASATDKPAV